MKQLAMLFGLGILGWMTWRLGTSLSSDALGMAVGVVFGVLAGIPTTLLVLATNSRRREQDDDADEDTPHTVNVSITHNTTNNTDNRQLTVNTTPAQDMPLLADRQREIQAQRGERVFKVVGEREEW